MSKRREISRRDFASRSILAVAGVAAGKTVLGAAKPETGPALGARVLGANDRVVVASIGIRGQGDAVKRGFARLPNVEVKTLCDVDENLFASRAKDPALENVATFRPGYQRDLRRVFDDKDVDAVIIATPNHWHTLAAIYAIQAIRSTVAQWRSTRLSPGTARKGTVASPAAPNHRTSGSSRGL